MNPKRRKDISIKAAKELNIPVDHMDDIISTYYSYVTKVLTDGKHLHVRVLNLGTFNVMKAKVKDKLSRVKKVLVTGSDISEAKSFGQYEKAIFMQDNKAAYERLLILLEEEAAIKKESKQKRIEYENQSN